MIKALVNRDSEEEVKRYPKLMESKEHAGLVILMYKEGVGTVITKANSHEGVGYYSEGWRFRDFKDYKGTITISNQ